MSSPSLPRVAVVGGGIAGLACAHELKGQAAVELFEAGPRLGGHVHAVHVAPGVEVEVGFLAFHRSRYPELSALLDAFGIETGPSGTGLSIVDEAGGLSYRHGDWFNLFGTRLPVELRAQLSAVVALILRHERAPEHYPYPALRLDDWLARQGYHPMLARQVLVPAISALWGFQPHEIMAMAAGTVLESLGRFAGAGAGEAFERIVPSTAGWLAKLGAALEARVRLEAAVADVREHEGGASLWAQGARHAYDAVVVATHADQALALLAEPTEAQQLALGGVRYRHTAALLHDDPGVLGGAPANEYTYRLLEGGEALTTWDMGLIQQAPGWYVTVGSPELLAAPPVPRERIHYQARYAHPAGDLAAAAARARLGQLPPGPIAFCGSYFGATGSNECAVASGRRSARRVLARLRGG